MKFLIRFAQYIVCWLFSNHELTEVTKSHYSETVYYRHCKCRYYGKAEVK